MISAPYKVAIIAALLLVAVGCGGGNGPSKAESSTTPSTGPRRVIQSASHGADRSASRIVFHHRSFDPPPTHASRVDARGYYIRGIDRIDNRLLATDESSGALVQSSDWGLTWSGEKGLPPGLQHHVMKIVRFGRYLYLLATGDSPGVWRAAPAAGDTQFAWSPELLQLTRGTTGIMTDLEASHWPTRNFLFVGTYGDPVGGPSIWRIAQSAADGSGTAWARTYGPDAHDRHIHAVAPDPYVPGDVWATIGDGGQTTLVFSNDYGASWVPVIQDYNWQAVEISFDVKHIYLAGDQPNFSYAVLDRATFSPLLAAPNQPAELPIPIAHAPGDRYFAISYFGAVDPSTGVYYCVANDTSSAGTWMGMFFARQIGERIQMLDPGGRNIAMNGEVFIAHGTVYSGEWQHQLLPAE